MAQRPALPMLRTSQLFAEARGARQKSLVQEAGTACPFVWTPPHAAEASSSRGCRKQPGCPLKGRLVHGGCNSRHRALAVGRDEPRPTNGSGPVGPTPESAPEGGRNSRMAASCHRPPAGWVAATSHDRVSKKAGKTWTMWNVAGFFLGKKPRENFPDVECDRGVLNVHESLHQTRRIIKGVRR